MRFATRVALGAAVGVFGLLGQLLGHRIRGGSERAAPYVLGAVALVLTSILPAAAIDLRRERDRCLRCCNFAGYPSTRNADRRGERARGLPLDRSGRDGASPRRAARFAPLRWTEVPHRTRVEFAESNP
jgi:hypothetical protein